MKKFVFATIAIVLLSATPVYAQVPEAPDVALPEQTTPSAGEDQYGEASLNSIEEGLENAGEHSGGAAGGTEAYIGALSSDDSAEAATLPSEAYTELPDTGGISLVAVLVAGALIVCGGLLFLFTRSRG